jgi:hypothetical protein
MSSKLMDTDRLEEQSNYIEAFIGKTKSIDKYDGILVGGNGTTNCRIVKAINGELKNMHNTTFKSCLGKKCCEECGEKRQLDRAHTLGRLVIAESVLNEIHPDLTIPIDMKIFMVAFILEHKLYGVWMLCKECHKKLG